MTEVKAYTVAIGNFSIPFTRDQKKILKIIKNLDGFYGLQPHYPHGTLLIFKSENDAKRAKNQLDSLGILTGKNICEVFIPSEYAKTKEDDHEQS